MIYFINECIKVINDKPLFKWIELTPKYIWKCLLFYDN